MFYGRAPAALYDALVLCGFFFKLSRLMSEPPPPKIIRMEVPPKTTCDSAGFPTFPLSYLRMKVRVVGGCSFCSCD